MKFLTALLLIISFISLSVFSLAIFDHSMNHLNNNCLIYTINGVICPTNIIEFALKTLILSIFNLFLILGFLFLIPVSIFLLFHRWLFSKSDISYSWRQFIRWLALLEHSPSF